MTPNNNQTTLDLPVVQVSTLETTKEETKETHSKPSSLKSSSSQKSSSSTNNNNNNKNNDNHKMTMMLLREQPALVVPRTGFNVVLTHCTADFDSLASAVALAKLWSAEEQEQQDQQDQQQQQQDQQQQQQSHAPTKEEEARQQQQPPPPQPQPQRFPNKQFDSASHVPTFVVLPRGAHPGVQRFLALHKHLFPIRSLKSLPSDLSNLNRLALVDAQRRDRLGPAEHLLSYAKRITVVDHHIDQDSDIPNITDYVVDKVGSVTTLMVERFMKEMSHHQKNHSTSTTTSCSSRSTTSSLTVTPAETTLFALGIHADTGSLCFDSTTPRDAMALAWCLQHGASQAAIAEHAQSSLSAEQQGVLTQALMNANATVVHGVTVSTVLLQADGFINGLAAVTQDALELSSSDVFLLALVYRAQSGGKRRSKKKQQQQQQQGTVNSYLTSRLWSESNANGALAMRQNTGNNNRQDAAGNRNNNNNGSTQNNNTTDYNLIYAEAWKGGEDALRRQRLRLAFDRRDIDGSGYLERSEVAAALANSGVIASVDALEGIMEDMDTDGDGRIDFEEFVTFAEKGRLERNDFSQGKNSADDTDSEDSNINGSNSNKDGSNSNNNNNKATTMIIIGRVRAGVNTKAVKLNKLFEPLGGGGHPKAASATLRLGHESEARDVLQGVVNELIETSLQQQPTVGDFMTAPVLSVQPHMTEKQVEDLFTRYDVRALPVVDEKQEVIGLVTYKEVAAAKQRRFNKEQKRTKQQQKEAAEGAAAAASRRTSGSMSNETSAKQQQAFLNSANATSPTKKKEREAQVGAKGTGGSTVKGWMLQHIQTVEASKTMAEVESILLENDVGCIPVVADGTRQLVGMVTRTDLLRQHRYYPSLHYHNKGFADSIAARKPIIALRKKLKQFDVD